ncbi:diguanylate cyclase [Vibrio sp. JC009]|uniref:diguanylate cyclase domain-containing protein n=1 Tax=Vibrio sp. JC009 TaxID=2912314 RepID=UPI0023B1C42A|nr:diguanylate cyclase [Vibrio sp. JC009]WED22884.1 diguanylate cyclase [Vibrio sp. JC009]
MAVPKPKIMIVDDVKANSRLLAKRLGDEYDFHIVTSGKEALEDAEKLAPDLILLDILMPEMDGFEVCYRLKENEATKLIPVVFITSLDDEEDETKGLDLGAVDYIKKPFRIPIIKARIRNHIQLKQARDLLEKQAFIDSLTAIPNRRRFDEILEKEWYRAAREQASLSMILLDIDHFKQYNDSYGHQQGDYCLIQIGRALKESMRRASDFVARYGGEEFAVILPSVTEQEAVEVAKFISQRVAKLKIPHCDSNLDSPYVTVSMGVTSFKPSESDDPESFFSTADKALYQAKNSGRNQIKSSIKAE